MTRDENPVLTASLYPRGVYRDRAVAVNPHSTSGWIFLDGIEHAVAKLCDGGTSVTSIASRVGIADETAQAVLGYLEQNAVVGYEPQRIQSSPEPKPPIWTHLYLELTLRCNLACLHCNVGSPVLANMSEEDAMQALGEFASHGKEVTFSGGEPTLVRHLPRLIDRAVDLGLDVGIITNGIRLQDSLLDQLRRTGAAVCVSMDGADALTHDRLRGLGAFHKTIATVRRLVEGGLGERMALSFTPVHGGVGHLSKMEELADSLGVPTLYVSLPESRGRLMENADSLGLDHEEMVQLLRFIYDRMLQPHPTVTIDVTDEGAARRDLTLGLTDSRRNALGSTVRISATGGVYVGSLTDSSEFLLGSFPAQSLTEIHGGQKFKELWRNVHLRATTIPKCQTCVWQSSCAGGIVTSAANDRGDFFAPDIFCDARRQILPEYIERIVDNHTGEGRQ